MLFSSFFNEARSKRHLIVIFLALLELVRMHEVYLYQKTVGGTCYGGASPFEMVPQIMRLYRAAIIKLDELVTNYYSLDQINDAFSDMLAGKNICGVIRMQ